MEDLALRLALGKVKSRPGSVGSTGTYVEWYSMRHNDNTALKEFATSRGLPVLHRKWDRIDTTFKTERPQKAEQLRELIRMGLSSQEIASRMGVGVRSVYASRGRMKEAASRGGCMLPPHTLGS